MKPVRIQATNRLSSLLRVYARLAKARARFFEAQRSVATYEKELQKLTPEGVAFYNGISSTDVYQLEEVFVCQFDKDGRRCGKNTRRALYGGPSLAARFFCDEHAAAPLPDGAQEETEKEAKATTPTDDIPF